jgi:hypothetical protein
MGVASIHPIFLQQQLAVVHFLDFLWFNPRRELNKLLQLLLIIH